ncbi:MAG: hypothetical protein M5U14_02395 [Acidimicrobiia bacterium]|nr:hypothetical protein [Acidimicrobiia bacterium]
MLREPDGSGGFQGLDPGCLDTAGRLNGAGVTVEVLRNGLADVTAEIDGTELEVTYKAYADPIPAWATQACDPGAEGVQFVFTGRSRVFAAGGTIELCAGPDDPGTEATAQRVAFHAGSAAGCVASNACPVLGTAGGLFEGGAAIHGTVVAPEALVELKGSSPVPVVDRGSWPAACSSTTAAGSPSAAGGGHRPSRGSRPSWPGSTAATGCGPGSASTTCPPTTSRARRARRSRSSSGA